MATKPLKTITFEGLEDTYTIPQIDDTLSVTGGAADAKVTGDSLKAKAEAEGAVSMAKALVGGKYTLDQSPYHYRKSPCAGALDEKIVGGTLAWNQIRPNTISSDTKNGITLSYDSETGIISLSGTSTSSYRPLWQNESLVLGHKYALIVKMVKNPNNLSINFNAFNGVLSASDSTSSRVVNCTIERSVTTFGIEGFSEDTVMDGIELIVNVTDLTTMLGSTIADYIYSLEQSTAGAGVAKLKECGFFTEDYYEYCEPTLRSVEGLQSRDVVGFNQWDEEWEVGVIKSDGSIYDDQNRIVSKNYIRILPSTQYYVKGFVNGRAAYYDADKQFVAFIDSFAVDHYFTAPSNAQYLKFSPPASYGTAYNHDICINLSDPSRNGTYEPYEKHSYPLDSTLELRGIPKLSDGKMYFDGDEYSSDGQVVRRYGIVDLGTLDWSLNSTYGFMYATVLNGIKPTSPIGLASGICVRYTAISDNPTRLQDGQFTLSSLYVSSSPSVEIMDADYTDPTAFKTAMSGVMLVYELATPTTETAQPYQSPQLAGSTEEYVTTGVVPVGHESRYYEDVAKKVSGLPKDFSTLIAPVEITFTATRNYSVGNYLIVNNQLYKVSSAISSGGTITPNSNVTATTIMAEILALA